MSIKENIANIVSNYNESNARRQWINNVTSSNMNSAITHKLLIKLEEKVNVWLIENGFSSIEIDEFDAIIPNYGDRKNFISVRGSSRFNHNVIDYDRHLEFINKDSYINYDLKLKTEIKIRHGYTYYVVELSSKIPAEEMYLLEKLGKVRYETNTSKSVVCETSWY